MSDVVTTLYYDEDRNLMMDEDGFLVFNIYDYITPLMYRHFLEKKESVCIETRPGIFVELIYPEEDD